MSSIFPIREKVSLNREPEPRLIDLDEDTADEVFEALAASTTRKIFLELHNQPQTASDLADVTDTSVQNVQYHLEKLTDIELVEVVDTWYSERGSEMNVYAPTDESLVLFAGRDKQSAFRRLLNRFAGVLALLVPPSILAGYLANWQDSQESAGTEFTGVDGGGSQDGQATDGASGGAKEADGGAQPEDVEEGGIDSQSIGDSDESGETSDSAGDAGGGEDDAAQAGGGEDTPGTEDATPNSEKEYTSNESEVELTNAEEDTIEFDTTGETDIDSESIEVDVSDSPEVAEAIASENETVYLVAENTSNEILGIDPSVAAAFFLGGLVVYGMFVLRRRSF